MNKLETMRHVPILKQINDKLKQIIVDKITQTKVNEYNEIVA